MKTFLSTLAVAGVTFLALGSIPASAQETKPAPVKTASAAKNPVVVMKTSMGDITIELFIEECPKTVANFIGLAEGTLEFTDAKTGQKAKRPYYDGISFHRVIPNFMAQGGCPTGNGTGGPGFQFEDEINADALGLNKVKAVPNGQPHRALMIRSQQDFQKYVGRLAIERLGIKNQAELEKRQEELNAELAKLTLKDVFEGQGYVYNSTRKSHAMDRGTIAMANSGPNTNGSQFFLNMADNHYLNGKHTVFGRITKGMEVVDAMQKVKMGASNKPLTPIVIESVRTVKPAAK